MKSIKKDFAYILNSSKFEIKRKLLKCFSRDTSFTLLGAAARLQLSALPRKSSIIRISKHCHVTGRSKSIIRTFKLSRIAIREELAKGALPGVMKSSW